MHITVEMDSTLKLKPRMPNKLLTSFNKFQHLPAELREMIWKAALLNPLQRTRWVVIYTSNIDSSTLDDENPRKYIMLCKHLISPLLSVNTESRKQARNFFHLQLPVHRIGQVRLPPELLSPREF